MNRNSENHVSSFSMERLRAALDELFRRFEVVQLQHELIRELDHAILRSTSSATEVLNIIVEKGRQHTDSQHGQVVVIRRHRLMVEASTESTHIGDELPLDRSLCGKAVREGKDQHCPNVSRIPEGEYVRFHEKTNSELALLIRPEHGTRILGVLNLEREKKGDFDPVSVNFAKLLAGQAAIAIEQARVRSSVSMVHRVSTRLLLGELSVGQAYREILDAVLESLNFDHGQVLRRDGNELVIIASSREKDTGLRINTSNSVCGRYLIAERGRNILNLPEITESPYKEYYLPLLRDQSERPMRSELIVPLVRDDRLIGALNIESPQVDAFSEFDENLLSLVADLMAHALAATLRRTSRVQQERIETANLAMTQLGHVAQNFLHRFGSLVGHARANLIRLPKFLGDALTNETDPGVLVSDVMKDLVSKLSEAGKVLDRFAENFKPDSPSFQVRRMDLAEIVKEAVDKFQKNYADKTVSISFESRLPLEQGARGEIVSGRSFCQLSTPIYEVIENLLNNAADAIQDRREKEGDFGQGWIQAIVDLADPLYVRLRISDNGAGIPPENANHVFKFGFSTKTTKRRSSIGGIGLWFCEFYLLQRGGNIAFHTDEGGGTTFTLLFPIALSDDID